MPSQGTTPLRACARCGAMTPTPRHAVRLRNPTVICRPCIIADDELISGRVRSRLVDADCGCCRVWPLHKDQYGYGTVSIFGQMFRVHRLILEAGIGPMADDRKACHDCPCGDRPDCAEITHLFDGSNRDNAIDASEKGRLARGERHGCVRLSDAQVQEVRTRIANGERHWEIAASLGVARTTITAINLGRTWAVR